MKECKSLYLKVEHVDDSDLNDFDLFILNQFKEILSNERQNLKKKGKESELNVMLFKILCLLFRADNPLTKKTKNKIKKRLESIIRHKIVMILHSCLKPNK